jgi:hypothetical protein
LHRPGRLLLDPEEYPEFSSGLHPIKKTDMILQVRKPTKGSKFAKMFEPITFKTRSAAEKSSKA